MHILSQKSHEMTFDTFQQMTFNMCQYYILIQSFLYNYSRGEHDYSASRMMGTKANLYFLRIKVFCVQCCKSSSISMSPY